MKQPLQPAGQILCAATNQGDDLVGTQKAMPVDESDDFSVTLRQLNPDSKTRPPTCRRYWPTYRFLVKDNG